MKYTDKLTKKQVLAIPVFLNEDYRGNIWTIKKVADRYKVTEQAIYYWIRQLRKKSIKVNIRKQGQRGLLETDIHSLLQDKK